MEIFRRQMDAPNLKHKVEDWAGNRDVQVIHVKVAIRSKGVRSLRETRDLEVDPCGTSSLQGPHSTSWGHAGQS